MPIALNLDVEVTDGTRVLTDRTGPTIPFSKAQSVQQKGSMITLGDLCGLPQRQLAAGFGFKTRKSSYDSRKAVLQGSLADLFPKRRGPRSPSIRTKEIEAGYNGFCGSCSTPFIEPQTSKFSSQLSA